MFSPRRLAALFAVVVSTPFVAPQAQTFTHFNIAAGLTPATGTFGDRVDAGYNIIAGLGVSPPGSPLGFRVEGIYNGFNQKVTSASAHAAGVSINGIYNLMPMSGLVGSLYGIGGVGYYSTQEPAANSGTSQTNFGWNAGGGFRFPLGTFSVYVEARYHAVSNSDMSFVPISFGLVF